MFAQNRFGGFCARLHKLVYGFRERLWVSDNPVNEIAINSSAWRSERLLYLLQK